MGAKLRFSEWGGGHLQQLWQTWSRAGRSAACDLLFPPRCSACGADLPSRPHASLVCPGCRRQIVRMHERCCRRCAGRLPALFPDDADCHRCSQDKPEFDAVLALGSYEGLLKRLVQRMKTDASEALASSLARMMADEMGDALRGAEIDAIAWIPSHPWRRWRRGADGPAALAQRLSAHLGLKLAPGLLRKGFSVAPQKDLSRQARKQNLRGGLVAAGGYQLNSAHVAVVDDVLTTGATCHEAARVLKKLGARKVTIVVAARASSDG